MSGLLKRVMLSFFIICFCFLCLAFSFAAPTLFRMPFVTVGAKNHTEHVLIGEICAQLIENHTDLKVKRKLQLDGTMICFEALRSGDIDFYCEYTGTAYVHILKQNKIPTNRAHVLQKVKDVFYKKYGLVWLDALGFSNQYVIAMLEEEAERYNIKTLTQFCETFQKDRVIKVGLLPEFVSRPEFSSLKEAYQLDFSKSPLMEKTLAYLTLSKRGQLDAVLAFSTDGLLSRYQMRILEDDLKVLPPYDASIVVRERSLEKYPQIKGVLSSLSGKISVEIMQKLNDQVEREGKDYKRVATEFLESQGLLKRKS